MAKKIVNGLEQLHEIAKSKGGKCLSTQYLGGKYKYQFHCKEDHEWYAPSDRIKSGSWCPWCSGRKVDPASQVNKLQKIVVAKGGRLLDGQYKNTNSRFTIECSQGHQWDPMYGDVVGNKKTWCPYCSGYILIEPLKQLQDIAKSKGGKCLSTEYINDYTKYKFKCNVETHSAWEATASNIKYGFWCKECGYIKVSEARINPNGLQELQEIAKAKGGECLSTKYFGSHQLQQFRCIEGHEWPATSDSIKRGSWCPQCVNKTEALIRHCLEVLFQYPFPQFTPDWLKEYNARLDGYNDELKLAFEYHGEQHVEHNKFLHQSRSLEDQQQRDEAVRELCRQNGVTLIEIWPLQGNYSAQDIVDIIKKATPKEFQYVFTADRIQTFLDKPYRKALLEQLQDWINIHHPGGKILSKKYLGVKNHHEFQCEKGHYWETAIPNIEKGHWCRECGKEKSVETRKINKNGLQELQIISKSKGGECLSTEYLGVHNKHQFRCAEGHEWPATSDSIKRGSWCRICGIKIRSVNNRIKNGLQELQEIAKAKGGECLSTEYLGVHNKHQFRCAEGHEWETTAGGIKGGKNKLGTWCPYCIGLKIVNPLNELHEIAKYKGGECLASEYLGSLSKHRFRCIEGHEWASSASNIKTGHWCRKCADKQNGIKISITSFFKRARTPQAIKLPHFNSLGIFSSYQLHRLITEWEQFP
jgi:hypothetical protein